MLSRQLIEEDLMDRAEGVERRQLDHGLDLALEQDRQHDDVERRRLAEARTDVDVIVRRVRHQDALFLERALTDQALADAESIRDAFALAIRVSVGQLENRSALVGIHQEECALMRGDQGRQLRHDHSRNGFEIFLALHHARKFREVGLEPVLLLVLLRRLFQVHDHLVDVVGERRDFAERFDLNRSRQVAFGNCGGDIGDRAHLGGQVTCKLVHVIGQVAPGSGRAGHARLTAQFPFDTDLAGHCADLVGEDAQSFSHAVDRVGQCRDLAFRFHTDQLSSQVAVGDGGHDFDDAADLGREVRRHEIHVVGEILPGAGDAGDARLAAEFSFDADLARHRADLLGESAQRVGHVVDRDGERFDLAARIDDQFLFQVAVGDGGHDFDDAADLGREVRRHEIDVVGQIFPDARHAFDFGLAAQFSFGADFARDARNLRAERIQLIHHRIDRGLQFEDLAFDVDRDFLRQVAVGDRGHDLDDTADLVGQVAGQHVDVVGQILPDALDAFDFRLAAEFSVGADFARDAGNFRGERPQLIHHRVHGVLQLQDFAFGIDRNFLRQVAVGNRGRDFCDVSDLGGQIIREQVDVVGQILPGAGDVRHFGLRAQFSFRRRRSSRRW